MLRDTDNESVAVVVVDVVDVVVGDEHDVLTAQPPRTVELQFGKIDISRKIRGSLCRILRENTLAHSAVQKKGFFCCELFAPNC